MIPNPGICSRLEVAYCKKIIFMLANFFLAGFPCKIHKADLNAIVSAILGVPASNL
jgi:hypothetical protein